MPAKKITLLAMLMAGSALVSVSGAYADETTETVVVTGSRIPVTNASSASPLSVATADQIRMTSAVNIESVLTKMAGASLSGITNATNNGGVGVSSIGLRDLGAPRTLVLIDGERLLPVFQNSSSVPDLNSIPVSMVSRIEVLRDSASSIYGADAIGGVINIITKKDFEGFQVDTHGGASQHGGGDSYGATATLGFNLDRGNVTIALSNEHLSGVSQADRDWAQDTYIGTPMEGGSSYRNQLNIFQDENSNTVWNGNETTYRDKSLSALPCLAYLPTPGRVKLNAGCPAISDGGQTLTGEMGRTQLTASGHYDITPDITFVAQGFFTQRNSGQGLRPEPLLGDSIASTSPATGGTVFGGFMVPVSWPGYSDPNHTASVQPFDPNGFGCKDPAGCITGILTPNDFGPRTYRQTSDTYRIQFGFQGHIFGKFNWEAGYVEQHNDTTQRVLNSGNWLHLAQATGQMACVDYPGGCVDSAAFGYKIPATPPNFFNGVHTLSAEQIKYLTFTMTDTNTSDENYFYADANGSLFELPAGSVDASIGVERRFEKAGDSPDALEQLGYAPNPSAATRGSYAVSSIYGELRVPLLADKMLAKSLVLTPSVRYDDYSSFGSATTWKVGADWQVIDDIRFRGSYSTGFRAPSVSELYGGNAISYVTVNGDPCDSRAAGFNGNSNAGKGSLAAGSACFNALTASGLTPAQIAVYQSPENNLKSDQRGLIIGGNNALQAEHSNSWNVGVVLTPTVVPGFSFDADYYETSIHNAILTGGLAQSAGPDLVVNGCYVDQKEDYCKLITRNASGIYQINSLNSNYGRVFVSGLEMQATYSTEQANLDLPVPGSFVVNIDAQREFTNTQENPDGTVTHFTGKFVYANEALYPSWKGTLNVDWNLDPVTLHWDSQFISGMKNFNNPTGHAWGNYIPDFFYHNISVGYALDGFFGLKDTGKTTELIFGINNLFDKDPPVLSGDALCKCNSIAGPYDFVGRSFYARITTNF